MEVLNRIKEEVSGDVRRGRDNILATQIGDLQQISKELATHQELEQGQSDDEPSNQQLRNIFENLDSVENEIRRLSHVVEHYFGGVL